MCFSSLMRYIFQLTIFQMSIHFTVTIRDMVCVQYDWLLITYVLFVAIHCHFIVGGQQLKDCRESALMDLRYTKAILDRDHGNLENRLCNMAEEKWLKEVLDSYRNESAPSSSAAGSSSRPQRKPEDRRAVIRRHQNREVCEPRHSFLCSRSNFNACRRAR